MPEFLLELYSEEIPPQLQISARKELKVKIEKTLLEEGLRFKSISSYSTPTRLTIIIKDIPEKVKIPSKEIKGPKVGVIEDVLNNFIRTQNSNKKDIFEKENEKGKFYFIKTKAREILTRDLLVRIILNSMASLNWQRSMKWSDNSLMWGRPLRSILSIFNKKHLPFSFGHLKSKDFTIIEQDLIVKHKKIRNFNEYQKFLKKNNVTLIQEEREKKILYKFFAICDSKNYQKNFNKRLLEEVVNILDNPNVMLVNFEKTYLDIPGEIIISKRIPKNVKKLNNNFEF